MSGGGYQHVYGILTRYWDSYGGWSALCKSPYLHAAVVVNVITYQSWMNPGWWESAVSVLASLIGFTLGGYAILIAFGDEDFKSLLTGGSEKSAYSPFVVISATFVHFIIIQILALLVALVAESRPLESIVSKITLVWPRLRWVDDVAVLLMYAGWFVGHGLFVYAIFLAVSATLGIFRISTWYDKAKTRQVERRKQSRGDQSACN